MPIHFEAITNDYKNSEMLAWLFGPCMNQGKEVFTTPKQDIIILRSDMIDIKTSEAIGKYSFLIWQNKKENRFEIQDVDVTLNNASATKIRFLENKEKKPKEKFHLFKRKNSEPEGNGCYEVELLDVDAHCLAEAANRYTVNTKLENTERDAFISAFPYQLNLFDDMEAVNHFFGFDREISVGNTGIKVGGLSPTFISPSNPTENEDLSSLVIGEIKNWRDVCIEMGEISLNFVLTQIETALGTIPVAMGREVFDIQGIEEGKMVAMHCYVKADLARPEDFQH